MGLIFIHPIPPSRGSTLQGVDLPIALTGRTNPHQLFDIPMRKRRAIATARYAPANIPAATLLGMYNRARSISVGSEAAMMEIVRGSTRRHKWGGRTITTISSSSAMYREEVSDTGEPSLNHTREFVGARKTPKHAYGI